MRLIRNKIRVFFTAGLMLLCLPLITSAQSETPVDIKEAEDGTLKGLQVAKSIGGYSGTGYVTGFDDDSDSLKVTVTVPKEDFYKVVIRYHAADYKEQYLHINNDPESTVKFDKTTGFEDVDAGNYYFTEGANTITLKKFWGYIEVDKFTIYNSVKNTYAIAENLVDINATASAKALYDTLRSCFGKKIISGQTDSHYDDINAIAGRKPRLRAFDFQHYTEGYSYLWDSDINGFSFGAEDDGTVQKAIDWYNSTGKKGIISFQWHWHSPSGGSVGTNTFYTNKTSFDVTKAVTPGTEEYDYIIRDIDTIAYQLNRFQEADIPVLWRPLHEAGGEWFWWGAKGPAACKELYSIVYDRLVNYHELHNLIWVWSTPEAEWYPGNDKVDIIGYDSYPKAFNYDIQKNIFDALNKLTNGEKLIAMTENGPIPDPEKCFEFDAPWLYFMSWAELVTEQNSDWHIWDVYNYADVLSFKGDDVVPPDHPDPDPNPNPDPDPEVITDISGLENYRVNIYPNPVSGSLKIDGKDVGNIEIINLSGNVVFQSSIPVETIDTMQFENGLYILKVHDQDKAYHFKLIITN